MMMFRPFIFLLIGAVSAHRPATTGPSCDNDYGSSAAAMPLADPAISWSFKHYLDCTHRAVWIRVINDQANQPFYVGVGIPTQDRFADVRANALIIGPGLPQLSADEWDQVPEDIRNDPVWNSGSNIGAYFHASPDDQSTCDHLGTVMQEASSVVNGRCDFYEPFGGSHSWRVLDADDNLLVEGNGVTYHVAVYLQDDTSAKVGIALGTWVENFITSYDIATPTCTRDSKDFDESESAQDDCFPVVSCPTAQGPIGCDDAALNQPEEVCELGQVCDEETLVGDCVTAGIPYTASSTGGCGGEMCPAAVQVWDVINTEMHQAMMDIEYTGNADVDFVRGMIPHHLGAVNMCQGLIQNLTCTPVESIDNLEGLVHFCNHIQLEQQIEVGGMRQWLADKGLGELAPCSVEMGGMGHDMTSMARQEDQTDHSGHGTMMTTMDSCGNSTALSSEKLIEVNYKMHDLMAKISYSCDHRLDFVRMMLPHHAGAVDMCGILMETTDDDYLIALCDNITATQRAEIAWMAEWLAARDLAPTAPCEACDADLTDGANDVVTFMPCEDTISTSSFCHGITGMSSRDGHCRCNNETFTANGFSCDGTTWVEGFGLFVPSVYCKRYCGVCPTDSRPLRAEPCSGGSGSGMGQDGMVSSKSADDVSKAASGTTSLSRCIFSFCMVGFFILAGVA
jgi:uncharacterized protein (DUF305 family)